MKTKMKITNIFKAILGTLLLSVLVLATSCADADGLHDQQALMVTFEFTGFGDLTGNFAIPGNFDGSDGWNNTKTDVTMKNGAGSSVKIPVTTSNIQFSLVPVNEWGRPWYEKDVLMGNGSDKGTMHNFYIDGLDLGAGEITLLVDAEAKPLEVTPVIK